MKMTVACAMTVLFSSIAWPQTSALPAEAMRPQDEISTRDEPVSFRAQTNLVEVPVIVRDRDGHAVGSLRQDSFRVFDKGKRQEIIKFAMQAATAAAGRQSPHPAAPSAKNIAAVFPDHFVAFLFDDLHIQFEDLPQVRAAAMKYIRMSLQPQDRVAVYTTSGHTAVDFTDRPAQLSEALARITPRPIRAAGIAGFGGCGGAFVSYFQAVQVDQQVGLEPFPSDADRCLALRVAVEEYADFHTAVEEIRDAYTSGLQESRAVLSALKIIVQRMGAAPGQRSLVLVSPGFFVPPELSNQNSDLMALAVRSKVLAACGRFRNSMLARKALRQPPLATRSPSARLIVRQRPMSLLRLRKAQAAR
jgi:VWFA-related protein